MSKLVKFVSIMEQAAPFNGTSNIRRQFFLTDIYINKNFIIKLKEDIKMIEMLISGKLPIGFEQNQKFTLLTISKGNLGEDISVIGSLDMIVKKLEDY